MTILAIALILGAATVGALAHRLDQLADATESALYGTTDQTEISRQRTAATKEH